MQIVWPIAAVVFVLAGWRLARILTKRRGRVEDRLEARKDRWDERDRGLFDKEPGEHNGSSEQEA